MDIQIHSELSIICNICDKHTVLARVVGSVKSESMGKTKDALRRVGWRMLHGKNICPGCIIKIKEM